MPFTGIFSLLNKSTINVIIVIDICLMVTKLIILLVEVIIHEKK